MELGSTLLQKEMFSVNAIKEQLCEVHDKA